MNVLTPLRALAVVTLMVPYLSLASQGHFRNGVLAASAQWQPQRLSDGQPDIQGFWQTHGGGLTVTLEEGAVTLLDSDRVGFLEASRQLKTTQRIGIVDPPTGLLPLRPSARERRREIAAHFQDPKGNLAVMDPSARCLGAGIPRLNYATPYNGYYFAQTPGYVVMFAEWNHEARMIPLDGRPHVGRDIRLWNGDSRGRWEDRTLVVDVTNFNGRAWFDWLTIQSPALHVVERFTLVDADTILYEATVEDPEVFTRPWKVAFPFTRGAGSYRLFEYACHEGNRYMESAMR